MEFRANELDGLSGIFWLFLNRGQYLASPQKVLLAMLNVGLVVIATALVCTIHGSLSDHVLTMWCSASWVYGHPGARYMRREVATAFLVPELVLVWLS